MRNALFRIAAALVLIAVAMAAYISVRDGHFDANWRVILGLILIVPSFLVFLFAGEKAANRVLRPLIFLIELPEYVFNRFIGRRIKFDEPTSGKSVINVSQKLHLVNKHWSPHLIGQVNETDVKVVKIKGEFEWHHHEHEDELFYVIKGRLLMQFRDREEWVKEGECIIVPAGVEHRPVAPEEVHLMLIEPRGTLNTGNVINERTVEKVPAI